MLHEDLRALLDRLDRISRAIDLGCTSVGHNYRPEVARVLVETSWEQIRVGHELTKRLAYDDLWADLPALVTIWAEIAARTERIHAIEVAAKDALEVARAVAEAIEAIHRDVAAVDDAQLQCAARPRDPQQARRATAAIRRLESTADRLFVDALCDDRHGRLDAAMAVLTTIAARATRERRTVGRRR